MPGAPKPLSEIPVPTPGAEARYETTLFGRRFTFRGLKALLGAADFEKAGDRLAGLAAKSELEREAARGLLSNLTLRHLYDTPLMDDDGRVDEVTRAGYDIDLVAFDEVAELTVAGAKEFLLSCDGARALRLGRGLTPVMAAAVAKLMDVHELILASSKIGTTGTARSTVGLPGRLSSRLQPNHPTDDLSALTLLVYTGLSLGAGDALIGVNPAVDTVENIGALLRHLDNLRRRLDVPTQICVLSHLRTQLACLDEGAPVEVMFQSLAGTARTLQEEFDCDVALLDHAYATMAERGALGRDAKQFMYFETGQGSEVSYGKHNGIDMTTAEALCYGLARRYHPLMVNNVTGFIGPETHATNMEMILSNLQDHFMGKLLGLPMGMAPCYTLHSGITTEGQQIATTLLTAAGANYFMDVYLGVDRMLAYFDTSGHDDQTLREIFGREPAPEFTQWALARGVFARDAEGRLRRGAHWGDAGAFAAPGEDIDKLIAKLPAAYGWENAGPRPSNAVTRAVRADLALAREAIAAELSPERLGPFDFRMISTGAETKEAHLGDPALGARLGPESLAQLAPEEAEVQIILADGLSAEAVHHNAPLLLPPLLDALARAGIRVGRPLVARNGRVKLAEAIGEALRPKLVIMLIGERPGGDGAASRSMSAYLAFRVGDDGGGATPSNRPGRYEYTVISNIHDEGAPAPRAAGIIAGRVAQILAHGAAGNRLERLRARR